MKYNFRPDVYVIIITLFCAFLLVFIWAEAGTPASFSFWLAVVFSLIFAWYISRSPLYTYVDDEKICIKHLYGKTTFLRNEITLRILIPEETESMIRTFGSGGLGGYIGYFQNKHLGSYYMLALNRKELAVIMNKKNGKLFVINFPSLKVDSKNNVI